jgi:hypothetical protein
LNVRVLVMSYLLLASVLLLLVTTANTVVVGYMLLPAYCHHLDNTDS